MARARKHIVVTGGAGFIGSHLCRRFLGEGHRVTAVDNLITGSLENVRLFAGERNYSFKRADISRPFSIPGAVDNVYHFASPASPPDYLRHSIETLKVGSLGTMHALELAKKKKAVYLFSSTSEVYGDPLVSPQSERYWGNVNPVGPRSVYDEGKRFSEALSMAYARRFGVNVKIARIFNTYGERMRPGDGRVIPNFILQALRAKPLTVYGDGSQTRSYCHIDDLVEGIARLAVSSAHTPVNLGNPNEMSVLRLAQTIIRLTDSKSAIVRRPLPVDDPRRRRPDITLAKKTLGWTPKVRLEDGLIRTIEYFRQLDSGGR